MDALKLRLVHSNILYNLVVPWPAIKHQTWLVTQTYHSSTGYRCRARASTTQNVWIYCIHIVLDKGRWNITSRRIYFHKPNVATQIMILSVAAVLIVTARATFRCHHREIIKAGSKLLPLRRRHFQMDFLYCRCMNVAQDFTEFFSWDSNSRYSSIGSDNGLAPTRRHPLSEPMVVKLLTHICVTWPQLKQRHAIHIYGMTLLHAISFQWKYSWNVNSMDVYIWIFQTVFAFANTTYPLDEQPMT